MDEDKKQQPKEVGKITVTVFEDNKIEISAVPINGPEFYESVIMWTKALFMFMKSLKTLKVSRIIIPKPGIGARVSKS